MAADPARVPVSVRWFVLDELDPAAARACCTDAELASVQRFATSTLRGRAVASLAARRIAVGEVLGVAPRAVALVVDPDGRRFACGPAGDRVAFSVSTCGPLGLVAVAATGGVGADVENFGGAPSTPAFVARVASPRERAVLVGYDDEAREDALRRLWTRKEAYLKATGEGIGAGLASIEVPLEPAAWARRFDPRADGTPWWCFDLVAPSDGCAAAVVVGGSSTTHGAADPAIDLVVAVP